VHLRCCHRAARRARYRHAGWDGLCLAQALLFRFCSLNASPLKDFKLAVLEAYQNGTMSSSNATEPFVQASATPFSKSPDSRVATASVTIKGLPPDHLRANCMGEYTKTERTLHGRSVYMGGYDDDMALWFDTNGGWRVDSKADVDVALDSVTLATNTANVGCTRQLAMVALDSAVTPDRITGRWMVDIGKQPDPSVRVCKFKSRDTTLVLTGLSAQHFAADCMGRYTRLALMARSPRTRADTIRTTRFGSTRKRVVGVLEVRNISAQVYVPCMPSTMRLRPMRCYQLGAWIRASKLMSV
jgi:hypothetical protein